MYILIKVCELNQCIFQWGPFLSKKNYEEKKQEKKYLNSSKLKKIKKYLYHYYNFMTILMFSKSPENYIFPLGCEGIE